MKEILCVDIGGSKYMVGVITPEGKILYSRKVLWKGEAGNPGRILGNIIQTVDEVLEKHPLCRKNPMGMTIPGLADPEKGVWRSSEFLGVFNLPVGSLFQRRYGVPLKMENDANACAYAECFFGEGRMCKDFLYLTVSNSIGGALCLNGEIYTGAWGEAGEFGMCPAEDLLEKNAAVRRPLELLASGRGLSDNYYRLKGLPNGRRIHAAVGVFNLPVGSLFQRRYGVPLKMENDANACAYAECFFGEGRMCKDFLYLTVSNSIGGALCLNGEIYTGAWGEAGEFGMCPAEDLLEKNAAVRRPLELLASGRGLSDNYYRLKGLPNGRRIHAAVLERYAQRGDAAAIQAFELEGTYLGRAIAHAAFLLNPRKVVLGGGLSLLFDTYKSSLMDTLRCEMKRLPDGMPEVKATSLGYHGALLGAAAPVLKVQQTEKGG